MVSAPRTSEEEATHAGVCTHEARGEHLWVQPSQSRVLYTAVIRSAIAYGAAATFHQPSERGPVGISRSLATQQNRCLRVITGAYRATPVRHLETEAGVLPLDLYLSKRLAVFEARLEASGKGQLIKDVCAGLRHALRQRRGRPRRQKPPSIEEGEGRAQWVRRWVDSSPQEEPAERELKTRWVASLTAAHARHDAVQARRPEEDRRRYRLEPAGIKPDFSKKALAKHHGLRKHESTALTQIRTGRIGLKAFLHKCRVPDVLSPRCSCGQAEQTPVHLFAICPETKAERRRYLPDLRSPRDFETTSRSKDEAGRLARWLLRLGRLRQFDLAERLRVEAGDGEEESDTARALTRRAGGARPANGRSRARQIDR